MTYIRIELKDSEVCVHTYRGSFPNNWVMLGFKNKITRTL